MPITFTNFAHSQIAVGISAGDTTIAVTGGHGARFPALGVGEYFYATIENAATQREIVQVTARATDSFTVVRGQDNTTAQAWLAGDSIALRFNAAAVEAIRDESGAVLLSGNQTIADVKTFSSTPIVPDASFALTKLADIATARGLGRLTAGSGAIEELTSAQWTASLVDAATTALPGKVELATSAEYLTGTDTGRVPAIDVLRSSAIQKGATTTLTGSSTDLTGIPSWAKEVTISIVGASTTGTQNWLLQLGDAGGIETANYLGAAAVGVSGASPTVGNHGAGFVFPSSSGGNVLHGSIILTLHDAATNTWVISGVFGLSSSAAYIFMGGAKALSQPLTQFRMSAQADTWDAGSVSWIAK